MHYTPNGKEARDRSKVGMVFSREPVKERVIMASAGNNRFTIPPGDPAYKLEASFTVKTPGTLLSLYPHMHLRGKAFEFRLVHPVSSRCYCRTLRRTNDPQMDHFETKCIVRR